MYKKDFWQYFKLASIQKVPKSQNIFRGKNSALRKKEKELVLAFFFRNDSTLTLRSLNKHSYFPLSLFIVKFI